MRYALFAATFSLVFVVAACGGAAPAAQPTPAPAKPAATSAAAPAPTTAPAATKPAAAATTSSFPDKSKSITFMIPWPAGGGTDLTGRLIAAGMEKELGLPVNVVNRVGASSQVGMNEVAKSKPDGYMVVITSIPSVQTPYLDPSRQATYGRKDFAQVANVVFDPEAFAVPRNSPYKSLKEVIDAAKASPGKINMGTPGLQTDGWLATRLLEKATGAKFNVVKLEASAGLQTALLGGHVDMGINSQSNFTGPMKNGDVRLLGIADPKGSKYFLDVPTFESQGYKVQLASSRGVSVPAGTPKEIVNVLASAIKKASETTAFQDKLKEAFLEYLYLGPDEYTTYWNDLESLVKPLVLETE